MLDPRGDKSWPKRVIQVDRPELMLWKTASQEDGERRRADIHDSHRCGATLRRPSVRPRRPIRDCPQNRPEPERVLAHVAQFPGTVLPRRTSRRWPGFE